MIEDTIEKLHQENVQLARQTTIMMQEYDYPTEAWRDYQDGLLEQYRKINEKLKKIRDDVYLMANLNS